MKLINHTILFVLVPVVLITAGFRNPGKSSCQQMLRDYMERFREKTDLRHNVLYVHMEIITDAKESARTPDSRVEARIYRKHNRMNYESNYVNIYHDTSGTITVLHPVKKIVQAKSNYKNPGKIQGAAAGRISRVRDSLMQYFKPGQCRRLSNKKGAVYRIDMEVKPAYYDEVDLRKIRYIYDRTDDRLRKQVSYYKDDHKLNKKTIRYHEVDFDYKNVLDGPARGEVFDGQGNLRPQYSEYRVADRHR